jgi:glycerate 2-kinase
LEVLPVQNNGAKGSHRGPDAVADYDSAAAAVRDSAAREIFLHALDATRVAAAIERRVVFDAGVLRVDHHRYILGGYERILLIAIGKAAAVMAAELLRLAGDEAKRMEGVVAGVGVTKLPGRMQIYESGHPSPNQASLQAAAAILRLLEGATERDLVIFLVSGGGSSLVEQMLRPEISLDEIAATHKALVECGAPIAAINAVRKHLSAVKGGRLAAAAAPAEQLTLFVSDVPVGELDALASGPTVPDRSSVADVRRITAEYGLAARLPANVVELLLADELAETPKPGDAVFDRSQWTVLLDSASLEAAAAAHAEKLGWTVTIDHTCDDWSADDAAVYLVRRLVSLKAADPKARVCLLSAGEVTVRIPAGATGSGGRNQHFALLCSQQIAGQDVVVLSAGSDGVDGNSPAAGAVVDGTTLARATALGYAVEDALAQFDSYGLLSQLGDAIMIGPTGNNLRDLRVLLAP